MSEEIPIGFCRLGPVLRANALDSIDISLDIGAVVNFRVVDPGP
jgi:hypothetical protein